MVLIPKGGSTHGEKQTAQRYYKGDATGATVWLIFYVIVIGMAAALTDSNAIELVAR